MGTIAEKTVEMGVEEWRQLAAEAREKAVIHVNDDAGLTFDRGGALKSAAELLRAATTFDGHANMMELMGRRPDTAIVDVWDMSDEDDTPAWPDVSTQLREVMGDNKKALQIIDHIDRLHDLAVEKGLPVITKSALVSETAGTA